MELALKTLHTTPFRYSPAAVSHRCPRVVYVLAVEERSDTLGRREQRAPPALFSIFLLSTINSQHIEGRGMEVPLKRCFLVGRERLKMTRRGKRAVFSLPSLGSTKECLNSVFKFAKSLRVFSKVEENYALLENFLTRFISEEKSYLYVMDRQDGICETTHSCAISPSTYR